jgi:hypothetical protein
MLSDFNHIIDILSMKYQKILFVCLIIFLIVHFDLLVEIRHHIGLFIIVVRHLVLIKEIVIVIVHIGIDLFHLIHVLVTLLFILRTLFIDLLKHIRLDSILLLLPLMNKVFLFLTILTLGILKDILIRSVHLSKLFLLDHTIPFISSSS